MSGYKGNSWSLSSETIEWIERELPKGRTILELGCGEGSVHLAKSYDIISVENDIRWINKIKERMPSRWTSIHAPLVNGWYDVEILRKYLPHISYDLLLVDAPIGKLRSGILDHLDLFKNDCPKLIDDTQRKENKTIANKFSHKMTSHEITDRRFSYRQSIGLVPA